MAAVRIRSHNFRIVAPLTKPGGEDSVDGNDWNDTIDEVGSIVQIASTESPFTPLENDQLVECDCTGGAITIALTSAATYDAKTYIIKKVDATANAVTIDPAGSETIDGSATIALSSQWEVVTIQSNGTNWLKAAVSGAGSGDVTGAANVGGAVGELFRDEAAGVLNIKTIEGDGTISVTNGASKITLGVSSTTDEKVKVKEATVLVDANSQYLDFTNANDFDITVAAGDAKIAINRNTANGIAGLDASALVPTANLGGAGASSSKYLRGDQTWATPSATTATWNVRAISASSTAAWGDAMMVTTGSTNRTITLTTAVGNSGFRVLVKKVDSGTGVVIIDPSGAQTVDGQVDTTLNSQYQSVVVVSDGTNVWIE